MKQIRIYCLGLLLGLPLFGGESNPKSVTTLHAAITVIDNSISKADRRAVLARSMSDRLRAERLWPFSGEAEHAKLILWIKNRWDLSSATDLGRYLEKQEVRQERRAEFLIDAWVTKYETGAIDEERLFEDNRSSQKFLDQIKLETYAPLSKPKEE